MAKDICPKEYLPLLVRRLEPVVYQSLELQAQAREKVKQRVIDSPKKTKRDLELHLELIKELHKSEDVVFYNMLRLLGNTRDEIAANLGSHVRDCADCNRGYYIFLMQQAVSEKSLAQKFGLKNKDLSLEDIAVILDRDKYLNIEVEI